MSLLRFIIDQELECHYVMFGCYLRSYLVEDYETHIASDTFIYWKPRESRLLPVLTTLLHLKCFDISVCTGKFEGLRTLDAASNKPAVVVKDALWFSQG